MSDFFSDEQEVPHVNLKLPSYVKTLFEQCEKNMIDQAVLFMESTPEWKSLFDDRCAKEVEARKKRVREKILRREEKALFDELVEEGVKKSKKDAFVANVNNVIEMTGLGRKLTLTLQLPKGK
ncbi:MAG: hypothetical protein K2Q45_07085 [Nitrosomonas sp.]|nr:hypothetical protein [Nitrosomonas sp.]